LATPYLWQRGTHRGDERGGERDRFVRSVEQALDAKSCFSAGVKEQDLPEGLSRDLQREEWKDQAVREPPGLTTRVASEERDAPSMRQTLDRDGVRLHVTREGILCGLAVVLLFVALMILGMRRVSQAHNS
jgi:hypothetical protein